MSPDPLSGGVWSGHETTPGPLAQTRGRSDGLVLRRSGHETTLPPGQAVLYWGRARGRAWSGDRDEIIKPETRDVM